MSDILSADEINNLLKGVSSLDNNDDGNNPDEEKIIRIYDFKRPGKFTEDQIKTITSLSDIFCKKITSLLTSRLDCRSVFYVSSIDQLTYEEFTRSIPIPTIISVVDLKMLNSSILYEIDPALTFTILDRFAGGSNEIKKDVSRDVTDLESGIMKYIISQMIEQFNEVWSRVGIADAAVRSVQNDLSAIELVPSGDMVLLITIETMIDKAEGMVNICLPYISIEKIIPLLSPKYLFSVEQSETAVKTDERMQKIIEGLEADEDILLNIGEMEARELLKIKKGSLIPVKNLDDIQLNINQKEILKLKIIDDKKHNLKFKIKKIKNKIAGAFLKSAPDQEKALSIKKIINEVKDKKEEKNIQRKSRYQINPVELIKNFDKKDLFEYIKNEETQMVALILSVLTGKDSAEILSGFSEEKQKDILLKIANTGKVFGGIFNIISDYLLEKSENPNKIENMEIDNIKVIKEILDNTEKKVRENLEKNLGKSNKNLLTKIKKQG